MDFQQQKKSKILVIGDVCIDRYIFGTCDRLSPEAPVPIIKQTKVFDILGMSGNVFSNISSMMREKFEIDWICPDPITIIKTRFIDSRTKNQILRHDVDPLQVSLDFEKIKTFKDYDLIIISDYDKGFLDRKALSEITSTSNCQIIVDTKKSDLSCFHNCLLKVNDSEAKNARNINNSCEMIVTLGSAGARYRDKIYQTKEVEAHDVCGAGDVFLSALAVRFLETKNIDLSIMTANACASYSVTKVGTYTLTGDEYENLCF